MASCLGPITLQLGRASCRLVARRRTSPFVVLGKGQRAGLASVSREQRPPSHEDEVQPGPRIRRYDARTTGHAIRFDHDKTGTGEALVSSRWLRDLCQCPHCVDPSSKQRNFLASDIPANIKGEVVEYDDNSASVKLKWYNDIPGYDSDHITTLPTTMLRNIATSPHAKYHTPLKPWLASDFASECTDTTYEDYISSDGTLREVLLQLKRFGLAFITNVPESTDSVSKIAERIGPIRHTLYGMTWDVRSVPDATNVAYTAKDLGFHMDLLPLKEPPALQVLHCIRSSAKGGNSRFMDAQRAAADLWNTDRQAFDMLCSTPITFHYDHPETHLYEQTVPVIAGLKKGARPDFSRPLIIRWSPPFQAPFRPKVLHNSTYQEVYKLLQKTMGPWQDAAAKFNEAIHKPEGIYERLMKPGECVIFHNTRVLHARTAFEAADAGKERWLHGAYVDADSWNSQLRVLSRKADQGLL